MHHCRDAMTPMLTLWLWGLETTTLDETNFLECGWNTTGGQFSTYSPMLPMVLNHWDRSVSFFALVGTVGSLAMARGGCYWLYFLRLFGASFGRQRHERNLATGIQPGISREKDRRIFFSHIRQCRSRLKIPVEIMRLATINSSRTASCINTVLELRCIMQSVRLICNASILVPILTET